MPDDVINARTQLRAALSEALSLDTEDGRIDEIVANVEDMIDAKIDRMKSKIQRRIDNLAIR